MPIEFQLLDALQTIHTPWLDPFMVFITTLGNGGFIWIILTGLFLLFPKTRCLGYAMALSLLLEALCCNVLLKPLVARIRPFDINMMIPLLIPTPHDFSFPSGHAGASFAVASALFFAKSRYWIPACILACLMAFSRLYLYVHYPSDVLAAIGIGFLTGWMAHRFLKKRCHKMTDTD